MSQVNETAVPSKFKRRRLVDTSLPAGLEEFTDSAPLYNELQQMEKSLDWTVTRKRMEIQEALARPAKVKRKLRIFLSHSMSGQSWQVQPGEEKLDLDSSQGIPAWTFRIEGRVLDSSVNRQNKGQTRKFSSFIKSMVVEFDRDPTLYAETNIVEWHKFPNQQQQDGFEIKRKGDASVKARVVLHLDHSPEHVKVVPPLSEIINITEDTRIGVLSGFWNYIKINGLQDKARPTIIKLDQKLAQVFGYNEIPFGNIPDLINQFLTTSDPVVLFHTITIEQPTTTNLQAFDIDIDIDDISVKQKINQTLLMYSTEATTAISSLEDEITQAAQSVRNAKLKHVFLKSFAQDPQKFIQTWVSSQSRDLEVILGDDSRGVRDEDLRRSEFFKLPWVREAVQVYEGLRASGALKNR